MTDSSIPFQCTWMEQKAGKHINWLELRAAWLALLQLISPGDMVQLHLDNMTAVVAVSHQENYHNSSLSVALNTREHRGGLPQQTQTADVGL